MDECSLIGKEYLTVLNACDSLLDRLVIYLSKCYARQISKYEKHEVIRILMLSIEDVEVRIEKRDLYAKFASRAIQRHDYFLAELGVIDFNLIRFNLREDTDRLVVSFRKFFPTHE